MEQLADMWIYPDCFKGPDEDGKYYISIGGWSGHEEIIYTLQENWFVWNMIWYSLKRGGHYVFQLSYAHR